MLERQALLLGRGTQGDTSILILDRDSGVRLGLVRSSTPDGRWSRWFFPAGWDIFETDDHSHVFSLSRSWHWSPEWVVRDAEGRAIGTVFVPPARFAFFLSDVPRGKDAARTGETHIEDDLGRCIARVKENGDSGHFLSLTGEELAWVRQQQHGTEVTFSNAMTENPFTRMLLLAGALVRGFSTSSSLPELR